jgi:hypothetical protein
VGGKVTGNQSAQVLRTASDDGGLALDLWSVMASDSCHTDTPEMVRLPGQDAIVCKPEIKTGDSTSLSSHVEQQAGGSLDRIDLFRIFTQVVECSSFTRALVYSHRQHVSRRLQVFPDWLQPLLKDKLLLS